MVTEFPFNGYYNVRERLDNLRHVYLDSAKGPNPVIKYDTDNNTVINFFFGWCFNAGDLVFDKVKPYSNHRCKSTIPYYSGREEVDSELR